MTGRFSTRPLYLQVRDALADRIATGEWKPRTAIPNEGDLAREFGVSSGTMRKALDLLEAEHLLTRRQGRGTFVNDQASGELAVRYSNIRIRSGEHIGGDVEVLEVSGGNANEAECVRLRMRPHERVHRIRRLRLSEGKAFMVEYVSMPAAPFPGLTEEGNISHRIVVLAQKFGILLGKGEERVKIGTASEEVAKLLKIAPGSSVLLLDRIVHTLEGRPIEWRLGECEMSDKYYLAEFR
jgi:GntR family transcriptional regulator